MRPFTLKELLASEFNLLPNAIYDTFPAPLFSRVLILSHRHGIFEQLAQHPQTADEVSYATGLHARSTSLILSSLHSMEYVYRRKGRYALTPQSRKWLIKSSPHYIGNFLAYLEILHSHWQTLEQTITTGHPPATYVETFTPKEWEIYTLGMMDLARLTIPPMISHIRISSNMQELLDVGGSHGLYSIELCRRHPQLHATIADFPAVLPTTQRIVNEHHLSDRICTLATDLRIASFEERRYDVALVFNIVHGFNAATVITILRSLRRSLRQGGCIWILDQIIDEQESGVGFLIPVMVGLNLQNEIGGTAYTLAEIEKLCHEAGFRHVRRFRLRLPGVSLLRVR